MDSRLRNALDAIDAVHAKDPSSRDGRPEELLYAERMSAALGRLEETPSPALTLAVRAQHLERWALPRTDYPMTRPGYHAWRTEQGRRHAALAAELVREAGFEEADAERVAALVRKRNRTSDPEAQTVEDCACLVFLEHELEAFAEGRERAQVVEILRKTWPKMSARAQQLALELPLSDRARAWVDEALGA